MSQNEALSLKENISPPTISHQELLKKNLMHTPRELELNITSRCNLRCLYCAHFTGDGDVEHELSTTEWLDFFGKCGESKIMELSLSGGEPFIRDDFRELINGIIENRMRYSILSNGTLISEEIADFLASTNRCINVQLSIDASKAEIHDSCRGNGVFELAMQGLKNLRKVEMKPTVRVTISRKNLKFLEDTAHFLLEEIGLPNFSTNSAGFIGLCRQNSEELQLNFSDRQYAMETLLRLNEKYQNRIIAAAGPLAEAKTWSAMERARLANEPKWPRGGALTACGCVWNKFSVRSDGAFCICNQIPHLVLGWANRDDLTEIWQNNPDLWRMRLRPDIPLDIFEICKSCLYKSYCTGNCPALAYSTTGNLFSPSPDACLKLYLEKGGKLPS
ncbi:MAG: SynChlorMet cassette radical SAM/SPASM protein ScmE [Candidatus Riflebacteria bacterium]|nr:SynChlorMet cassette radical SAM/SPASM protein ScmE [Candidatus Riflebacteria bacterium]